MKQFENKVLFIKDEEMYKEVKQLIFDAGKETDEFFLFSRHTSENFLYFHNKKRKFSIVGFDFNQDQEITLEQFKQLLKQ